VEALQEQRTALLGSFAGGKSIGFPEKCPQQMEISEGRASINGDFMGDL